MFSYSHTVLHNKILSSQSAGSFLNDYVDTLAEGLRAVSPDQLELASLQLRSCTGRIFVAGNGGSAAISQHLECDFIKGLHLPGVRCLVSNPAVITALANDIAYDAVIVWQLCNARACQDDLLILVSSSGNSPNIVKAAEYAHEIGLPLIGLSGFSGGRLRRLANFSLHVPINNYGVVEDAHQALMHILTQYGVTRNGSPVSKSPSY